MAIRFENYWIIWKYLFSSMREFSEELMSLMTMLEDGGWVELDTAQDWHCSTYSRVRWYAACLMLLEDWLTTPHWISSFSGAIGLNMFWLICGGLQNCCGPTPQCCDMEHWDTQLHPWWFPHIIWWWGICCWWWWWQGCWWWWTCCWKCWLHIWLLQLQCLAWCGWKTGCIGAVVAAAGDVNGCSRLMFWL